MRLTGFRAASACAIGLLRAAPAMAANTPIQHVVIIFQENRSFDNYFGTFPGANGIPAGVCLPNSLTDPSQGCVAPWHDTHDRSEGAGHDGQSAQHDLDDGITQMKMDGFVETQNYTHAQLCALNQYSDHCVGSADSFTQHDVMGYHDADELPNYWSYARHFVLHDAMFTGLRSWSTPSHIDMVSEWLANCSKPGVAESCRTINSNNNPNSSKDRGNWPWASMFQLLDQHGISWKYYLTDGGDPDCDDAEMTCEPANNTQPAEQVWNPPAFFTYVTNQGSAYLASHDVSSSQFWTDIKNGTLPQVSWIVPNTLLSEHPWGGGITIGQEYVTSLLNTIMQSQYWKNTAIFVVWDDWGGFYDNAVPPNIEYSDASHNTSLLTGFMQGFGLRVPAITISPWVKAGTVDHQLLSFASYNKFIEDVFMNGARLDPYAMGVPDARPSVRDALVTATYYNGKTAPIGDLMNDFDFTQAPLPTLILNSHIPGELSVVCRKRPKDNTYSCTNPTVTISWSPVAGNEVPGPFTYHVQRDGVELPSCTTTSSTCVDTPGSGNHFYRVYSVDSNNVVSPMSAATEADEP